MKTEFGKCYILEELIEEYDFINFINFLSFKVKAYMIKPS